jgi:hypothetical protein
MRATLLSVAMIMAGASNALAEATVVTDEADYLPGSVVQISGAGFQPGESVTLQVVNLTDPGDTGGEHDPWAVMAGANGAFATTWEVTWDELGATLLLTAAGQVSQLSAQTMFTDGNASDGTGTVTVSPTSVYAGTTNTLTLTLATDQGKDYLSHSLATIVVPAGWTAPQTNASGAAGYVSVAASGTGSGTITNISGTGPWTIYVDFIAPKNGNGFRLTYTNAIAPNVAASSSFSVQTRNSTAAGGVLAALAPSPSVTVGFGPANKLAFTTSAQTLTVGALSGTITVQIQDGAGNPTNATSARTITLSTTSGGGVFRNTADSATIASVVIAVGQNSTNFLYKDTLAGSPTITAASTSPTTLTSATQQETVNKASTASAVAASENPAATGATVWFTNTISVQAPGGGTPTGSVVFKDGAAVLGTVAVNGSGRAVLSTSLLAHGIHTITAEYAGDANYIGSTNSLGANQVINTPPVANLAIYARDTNISLKILISGLIANSTSDADGDTRTLTAVGSGTNGATITVSSKYIYYLPSTGSPNRNTTDYFNYTISDGYTTAAGTIHVAINGENVGPPSANLVTVTPVANGIRVGFKGLPGYTYRVQRATTFNGNSTAWSDVGNCAVDGAGNAAFTDTNPPPGQAYYRTSCP